MTAEKREPESVREPVHTRLIDAPRARVFAAYRDPAQLAKWWGPKGFTSTFHTFDFRTDGAWSFVMHGPDGGDYDNRCVFAEIVEPERVVVRHVSEPRFVLTATLAAEGARTRITWRQTFETAATFAKLKALVSVANEQNLDRLEAVLAGKDPNA